jgi:hypothetical protein
LPPVVLTHRFATLEKVGNGVVVVVGAVVVGAFAGGLVFVGDRRCRRGRGAAIFRDRL